MLVNEIQETSVESFSLWHSDSILQLINNAVMEYIIASDTEVSFSEPGLPIKLIYPILLNTGRAIGPVRPMLNTLPSDADPELISGLHQSDRDYYTPINNALDIIAKTGATVLSHEIVNNVYQHFIHGAQLTVDVNVCSTYVRRAYTRDIVSLRAQTNHFTEFSKNAGNLEILRDVENANFTTYLNTNNFESINLDRNAYISGLRDSDFVFILIGDKLYLYNYTMRIMTDHVNSIKALSTDLNNVDSLIETYVDRINENAQAAYEARVNLRNSETTIKLLTDQLNAANTELESVLSTITDMDNFEELSRIKEENRRLKQLEQLVIRGHDSNGVQSSHLIYEEPIDAIFDIRNININSKSIFAKYRYNLQSKTALDKLEHDWDKLLVSIIVDNKIPSSMLISESATGYTFSGKSEELGLSAYDRNLGAAVKNFNTTSGVGTKITKIDYTLVLVDNQCKTYCIHVVIS